MDGSVRERIVGGAGASAYAHGRSAFNDPSCWVKGARCGLVQVLSLGWLECRGAYELRRMSGD